MKLNYQWLLMKASWKKKPVHINYNNLHLGDVITSTKVFSHAKKCKYFYYKVLVSFMKSNTVGLQNAVPINDNVKLWYLSGVMTLSSPWVCSLLRLTAVGSLTWSRMSCWTAGLLKLSEELSWNFTLTICLVVATVIKSHMSYIKICIIDTIYSPLLHTMGQDWLFTLHYCTLVLGRTTCAVEPSCETWQPLTDHPCSSVGLLYTTPQWCCSSLLCCSANLSCVLLYSITLSLHL